MLLIEILQVNSWDGENPLKALLSFTIQQVLEEEVVFYLYIQGKSCYIYNR